MLDRESIRRALAEQHGGGIAGHDTVDGRNKMGQPVLEHIPAPRLQVISVERRWLESAKVTDNVLDMVAIDVEHGRHVVVVRRAQHDW